jgi:chemotaxis protein methyltransferase CheR
VSALRPDDITLVVSLCRARVGLKVAADKTYLIESRLAPIARKEGFASIPDMLSAIRAKREEPLIWAVVEAMTLGETAFFRDRAPFDAFEQEIYPALTRLRAGQPVKVWCAACSTGQEVYSLAMIAHRLAQGGEAVRIELAASDIAERALERAQSGLYSQFEVQRGLPIRLLVEHFEKVEDMWRLSPEIRRMVRWRRINLVAGLSAIGRFDVVFCRNVLSTMDPPFQRKLLEDLAGVVADDGFLVLGLKEDAAMAGDAFNALEDRPGFYRRNPAYKAQAA